MNDLGAALISLVADMTSPLLNAVSILCYLLGLVVFVQGCLRLLKYSEDRYHAPSLPGSMLTIVLATALVSLPQVLRAAGETFFSSVPSSVNLSLGYGAREADYTRLLAAVFTIVQIVGLLAFVRGAFMLRAASDGRPGATTSRAFVHMLGGVLGWYILSVIVALQTTLGIEVLAIS